MGRSSKAGEPGGGVNRKFDYADCDLQKGERIDLRYPFDEVVLGKVPRCKE